MTEIWLDIENVLKLDSSEAFLRARRSRIVGQRSLTNNQNNKVQENKLVHIFQDMTNASLLSERSYLSQTVAKF